MLKKSKVLMICAAAFLCLCFPVESKAYGENSSGDFYVKYPEPYCSEHAGYLTVMYRNSSNGLYRVYTYFWKFLSCESASGYAIGDSSKMVIDIDSGHISFNHQGSFAGGYNLVFGYYDWQDAYHLYYSNYFANEWDYIHQDYSSTPVVGYIYGGNAYISAGSDMKDVIIPTIHWNESVDATQLDGQMNQIIGSLNNIDYDTSYIISQLQNIYNQNVSIQQKLDNMAALLSQIKAEQEESNSWLEKIFNWLKDSPEQEKQEAQTQGNQSTSDATGAITDNSQGFIDSLGGLASSMSYSGTDCAWTFPAITLPAIPGVMDSVQLTSEQPIDFSYWVNQIPANLLLLIQSLLTIALIIYCFKEVYGTISYVLTLRGGGSE